MGTKKVLVVGHSNIAVGQTTITAAIKKEIGFEDTTTTNTLTLQEIKQQFGYKAMQKEAKRRLKKK